MAHHRSSIFLIRPNGLPGLLCSAIAPSPLSSQGFLHSSLRAAFDHFSFSSEAANEPAPYENACERDYGAQGHKYGEELVRLRTDVVVPYCVGDKMPCTVIATPPRTTLALNGMAPAMTIPASIAKMVRMMPYTTISMKVLHSPWYR